MKPQSVESTMHLVPGRIEPHHVVRIDLGGDTSDPPSVIDIGINPIGDEEAGVRNRGWERPDLIGVNCFDKESRFVFRRNRFRNVSGSGFFRWRQEALRCSRNTRSLVASWMFPRAVRIEMALLVRAQREWDVGYST
ncbi:hypothetical protein SLE2022_389040 [Rubroshorea leprosula]